MSISEFAHHRSMIRMMFFKDIVAVVLCCASPILVFADWVTPTGNTNGTGWTNGNLARDGNTATYASHAPAIGWGGWQTFSLSDTIPSDKFRVMADFGYGEVDSIQVDVSLDNTAWTTVFAGDVTDATWSTRTYTLVDVRYARFRFHRLTTTYIMWLYEFQLFDTPLVVDLPSITTSPATSIDKTSGIVHGLLSDDGGEPSEMRFQYGLTTAYEIGASAWVTDLVTSNTTGFLIAGLSTGVTYHFRAQARNSAGTVDGLDATFTCAQANVGWVSPTSSSDGTGNWADDIYSYDDELASNARCYHSSGDPNGQWGPYIILLHDSMVVDSIRFMAKDDANIDSAQVDISGNGTTWINVFASSFVNQTFKMVPCSSECVTQARIRFHVSNNTSGLYWELYEFDFYALLLDPLVLSVTVSNSTFAFGISPPNSWLTPQVSIITNNGNFAEDFFAQISPFTDGSNSWGISAVANGADQIRAQWSVTSNTGPWVDIAAYDTDFTLTTNVATGDSATLWLRTQTPSSTTSFNEHSSSLTITAGKN